MAKIEQGLVCREMYPYVRGPEDNRQWLEKKCPPTLMVRECPVGKFPLMLVVSPYIDGHKRADSSWNRNVSLHWWSESSQ